MCGNFGLLMLGGGAASHADSENFIKKRTVNDNLDQTLHRTLHEVSRLHGLRMAGDPAWTHNISTSGRYDVMEVTEHGPENAQILPPLKILEGQTAATEIRGGQAGGISTIEYIRPGASAAASDFERRFAASADLIPSMSRVRHVARKRYPLARDLAKKCAESTRHTPDINNIVTVVGHTRFATSSVNLVPELHPHEWVPPHDEFVWKISQAGRFERALCLVGVHISHNGDFDAIDAFSSSLPIDDIGHFLNRVLYVPNHVRSDSVKIAGFMDLLRVQGRWAPAARLAYVRCILKNATDVADGQQLSRNAPFTFPEYSYFESWQEFIEPLWLSHINNIIKVKHIAGRHEYTIHRSSEAQLVSALNTALTAPVRQRLRCDTWSSTELYGFLYHCVRGFLRMDLYTSLTELLSRAEGSFGIQVHCTLEPGVVVIASKGQPMSVSFDPLRNICLFGSEATALQVPVDTSGAWLQERIDLDSKGEIMRLGLPRQLVDESYSKVRRKQRSGIRMRGGIEILSYSLVTDVEASADEIMARTVTDTAVPIPYDPKADLVAADIAMIPAILASIDKAWKTADSLEHLSGFALCRALLENMKRRQMNNTDTTDLLIGGVEASLWVAEQWAADLRTLFPLLNVVTVSSNKLLGLGEHSAGKVFFAGADNILMRRINEHTCCLLISQSGQTFPTLHATKKLSVICPQRVWIVTGCFQSKMELAITESYQAMNVPYRRNRVMINYSGHRPAEPTSVAIVATYHTLTRLMMLLIYTTRLGGFRITYEWQYDHACNILLNCVYRRRLIKGYRRRYKDLSSADNSPVDDVAKVVPVGTNVLWFENEKSHQLMNLTDACISDMDHLLSTMIPTVATIVGYDADKNPLPKFALTVRDELVEQGKRWAEHINEPWTMTVFVGFYLLVSVGLGLPLFGCIASIIVAILEAVGVFTNPGVLAFNPRYPEMLNQPIGWTLVGLALQIIDAIWYIYMIKVFTWGARWFSNRPIWARFGKRTIVIVDTPCMHQLAENFVSKLFSQSYAFRGVDVHGASGLDHFVHRFTHRVVRGVLIAVGRPDGKLFCLAKSEAATLLAAKQAAFIQNPAYGDGSGPDFVTIGHNSFEPNLGLAKHIVLQNINRKKFIDEYIYDRMHLAVQPFTGAILRNLRRNYLIQRKFATYNPNFSSMPRNILLALQEPMDEKDLSRTRRDKNVIQMELPYGAQHIAPVQNRSDLFTEFVYNSLVAGLLTEKRLSSGDTSQGSYDPFMRIAFASKLDTPTQEVLNNSAVLQQFYECRIASLQRYIAFCVMFHAMAASSCKPALCYPWDIGRSQSNLRVATTASPISASDSSRHISQETKKIAKRIATTLRGFETHF